MKLCTNNDCRYYTTNLNNRCRHLSDVTLCECHNDDPSSEEVVEYKRKLSKLYLNKVKKQSTHNSGSITLKRHTYCKTLVYILRKVYIVANLTRYELTIQHGKDGEHVAVYHAMEDGEWVKFEDVKEFLKTSTNRQRDEIKPDCGNCLLAGQCTYYGFPSDSCGYSARV